MTDTQRRRKGLDLINIFAAHHPYDGDYEKGNRWHMNWQQLPRRVEITKVGAEPKEPWFSDMRTLVAKLRLLGIEVTWPGDTK